VTDRDAYLLRENTGTTGVVESARAAAETLADHDIPHLIVGGIAVQEHGYPRVTVDVDIVVPDVLEAVEFLTASLTGPFYRVGGCEDRVEDRRNGVFIDLLPAGKVLKRGCQVPFPQPTKVNESLQIVRLEDLVSLKLDSWANSPARRLKDKADVVELILRRKLPRDLAVAAPVRALYGETWDALQAES
jgi:phage tail protein X